jgi:hypothetical protein
MLPWHVDVAMEPFVGFLGHKKNYAPMENQTYDLLIPMVHT